MSSFTIILIVVVFTLALAYIGYIESQLTFLKDYRKQILVQLESANSKNESCRLAYNGILLDKFNLIKINSELVNLIRSEGHLSMCVKLDALLNKQNEVDEEEIIPVTKIQGEGEE